MSTSTATTPILTVPAYRPQANSLPSQVIAFFRSNPEEELTLEDITEKFDATRGNIHTLLRLALDAKMVARKQNDDGDYIYCAGTMIREFSPYSGTADKTAAKALKQAASTAPSGHTSARKMLDFDSLVVEKGIPFSKLQGDPGESKWGPLFGKLAAVGDSLRVPLDVKSALCAAVLVRNRKMTDGMFKVAKTSATEARIWRLA